MFTGIVKEFGTVAGIERSDAGARLRIAATFADDLAAGDSVSVAGACLTAAALGDGEFEADVMNQTLALTTLGELEPDAAVNLEPALRAGEPLGGHIVQGHVDGVGTVAAVEPQQDGARVRIEPPAELLRYVVEKGSITVDGVSLTVDEAQRDRFSVSLIPTTLELTTLGRKAVGDTVNLEVDVVAKYVERMLEWRTS